VRPEFQPMVLHAASFVPCIVRPMLLLVWNWISHAVTAVERIDAEMSVKSFMLRIAEGWILLREWFAGYGLQML
jgi:hypothetical protein